MSELLFVLKSFFLTVLLVIAMQIKVGSSSLEQYTQWWLQKSSVSVYVQTVAAGGALALKNLIFSVKSTVTAQAGR
jgi:ABC-type sulfate transport system permease component